MVLRDVGTGVPLSTTLFKSTAVPFSFPDLHKMPNYDRTSWHILFFAPKVLPQLTDAEVGIVCHALHQTFLYIETRHTELRDQMLRRLCAFPPRNISRDQLTVSSMAKFMKRRGAENTALICDILTKYEPYLHQLDHYTKLRQASHSYHGTTRGLQRDVFCFC
jgi:hypothetical protein